MIQDLWDDTIEPDLEALKGTKKKVSFDEHLNTITELLNWQKKFYNYSGINIVMDKEILPFAIYGNLWEGRKCIVFDYGIGIKDYVRQLPDKTWVGFLVNHNNKIILWFKLCD